MESLMARGAGLFNENSSSERKNEKLFFAYLLNSIETWPPFKEIKEALVAKGVRFPSKYRIDENSRLDSSRVSTRIMLDDTKKE